MTAFSCSMCSAMRAAQDRGLRPALGAMQSQADGEQLRDDVIVQLAGDPVPVGEHLQLARAHSSGAARCNANAA